MFLTSLEVHPPSGSDVSVTPKSIIQPTYQGVEEANFIEYGKRVLNRK